MSPERLAPVIDHARAALDRVRARHAERVRARARLDDRLAAIADDRSRAADHLPLAQREQYLRYCAALAQQADRIRADAARLDAEIDDLLRDVREAHRSLRSLEFLRERAQRERRVHAARRAQRAGDEQAVRNWLAEAS